MVARRLSVTFIVFFPSIVTMDVFLRSQSAFWSSKMKIGFDHFGFISLLWRTIVLKNSSMKIMPSRKLCAKHRAAAVQAFVVRSTLMTNSTGMISNIIHQQDAVSSARWPNGYILCCDLFYKADLRVILRPELLSRIAVVGCGRVLDALREFGTLYRFSMRGFLLSQMLHYITWNASLSLIDGFLLSKMTHSAPKLLHSIK